MDIKSQLYADTLADNERKSLSLTSRFTKGEAVTALGLITVDYALPQPWVDRITEWGYDPRQSVVWCYDDSKVFGSPVGLTTTAARRLREYADSRLRLAYEPYSGGDQ